MRGYDASTYGDSFADVYDDWYGDLGDVDDAVAMVVRLAERVGSSRRVLELAVGTGRLAIPLGEHGGDEPTLDVHGLDSSAAMLDRLCAKPGGHRVHLHQGDMATELPDGPFSVIFIAYNSLFNLDLDGQKACVVSSAARLETGGHFVVEAFVPDRDRPSGATIGVRSMSVDHVVLSIDVHHPAEQRAEGHFVEISESGGVRLRPWSVRYSSPSELDAFAEAAGLSLVERHEDWSGASFDEHSPRHVSVYRARA